jgi:hypothetical protein
MAEARVRDAEKAYNDAKPEPVALTVRSKHFIGPKRKRLLRKEGEDGVCYRCQKQKSASEFASKTGCVCSDCSLEQSIKWSKENPDKAKSVKTKWAERNKEKTRKKWRDNYHKNRDKEAERGRIYRFKEENRLKMNAWTREYLRRKKKIDPKWRALMTCKRRMWILFKSAGIKKNTRSAELMGIDRDGFYAYIESLWLPGMTWANRGIRGWHIDHIKPCSLFDMTDPEQAKACWHYTNLQPLWWKDNLRKSDSYAEPKKAD